MAQAHGVVLNQQLTTGKVLPILRFPSRTLTDDDWIITEPQLTAAIVSQGCKTAWNKVLDVDNDERADHPDNRTDDDARA